VYDIQEQREQAVTEYHAALTVRDGQADTKSAAEKGIKQPYALPPGARKAEDAAGTDAEDPENDEKPAPTSSTATTPAPSNDPTPAEPDPAPLRPDAPPLSSVPGAAQATKPHH
jgi:hypothetical protein